MTSHPATTDQRFGAGLAAMIALAATAGSLYLTLGLGLRACPLCLYQRAFMMGIVAVLSVGWAMDRSAAGLLCLAALPLATASAGVAAFQEYLVLAGKLECPSGILGLSTAPAQSLATHVVLLGCIVWTVRSLVWAALGSATLGLALAAACIASAPPLPEAPTQPYSTPLDICRPPFAS